MKFISLITAILLLLAAIAAGAEEMSVQQAINVALERNGTYQQLLADTELAELDLEEVRSDFRFKLVSDLASDARLGAQTGSRYNAILRKRNESGSSLSAGLYNTTFGDRYLSEFRLSYTVPLFDQSAEETNIRLDRSRYALERRRQQLEMAREELVDEVVVRYLDLVQATKRMALSERRVKIATLRFERETLSYEAGEISPFEYDEALLNFERTRDRRTDELYALLQLESEFKLFIGMGMDEYIEIDTDIQPEITEHLINRTSMELEQNALASRIELKAMQQDVEVLRRRRAIGESREFPVELTFNYSLVGEGQDLDESFQLDEERIGVGVRVLTGFDGNERKRARRRNSLQYEKRLRDMDALRERLRMEVRSAFHTLTTAKRELSYAERKVDQAERRYAQSEIQVREGRLSALAVLEREYAMAEARSALELAQIRYFVDNQALAKASGMYRQLWNY